LNKRDIFALQKADKEIRGERRYYCPKGVVGALPVILPFGRY